MFPLLVRRASTKDVTMSVFTCSGSNGKESLPSKTWVGFVIIWVMTSAWTMFSPPLMMLLVWVPPLIAQGPTCPMKSISVTNGFSVRVGGSVTTGLMSVGPLSDRRSILPRWDTVIRAVKVGVSLIGYFLAANFLSKWLYVTGIIKVILPKSLKFVTTFKPTAYPFQGEL